MFTALHALAQTATLMIVVSADGDELRVSVTPTQAGDKTKGHKLRPLSLLATPAELDAGFAEALAAWQAPKLSLLEQAKASTADDESDEEEPAGAAGKTSGAKRGRPAKKSAATSDAAPAMDAPNGAPPAAEQTPPAAPAAISAAVDTVTLDTVTLDLF